MRDALWLRMLRGLRRIVLEGPRPAPIRHPGVWSAVFGAFSLTTLVTMVFPATFGLQNFTQWGGMYDDHWCTVNYYSDNPNAVPQAPDLKHAYLSVGDNKPRVYSVPSHNLQSCLMWTRNLCGKTSKDGWTIRWVMPRFKSVDYLGTTNACDVAVDSSVEWFRFYEE